MSKLGDAIRFAAEAHSDQERKYDGRPYIIHPIDVMNILWDRAIGPISEQQLIAAILHDVVEDTSYTVEGVEYMFGATVAKLVDELTKKEIVGNRAARKRAERYRLASVSPEAQTVKLADIASNTKGIVKTDPSFGPKYVLEQRSLWLALDKGDPGLRDYVNEILSAEEIQNDSCEGGTLARR